MRGKLIESVRCFILRLPSKIELDVELKISFAGLYFGKAKINAPTWPFPVA